MLSWGCNADKTNTNTLHLSSQIKHVFLTCVTIHAIVHKLTTRAQPLQLHCVLQVFSNVHSKVVQRLLTTALLTKPWAAWGNMFKSHHHWKKNPLWLLRWSVNEEGEGLKWHHHSGTGEKSAIHSSTGPEVVHQSIKNYSLFS